MYNSIQSCYRGDSLQLTKAQKLKQKKHVTVSLKIIQVNTN